MKNFLLKYYPELTGIFVFFVYLSTMSPTISEGDSGELAAVQASLGIAHPTGYPLFTLIGYLASQIFFFIETIYLLNLLCAIWMSITVVIVIKTSYLLLNNISFTNTFGRISLPILKKNVLNDIIATSFAGLTLAFSITFWMQSSKVEVYALQILITSGVIYYTLKTFNTISFLNKKSIKRTFRIWMPVAILLGLGFSNHMMTIYLIPGTIILYFIREKFSKISVITIFFLILPIFCIPLIFYLLMMLRAQMFPVISFGEPTTLTSLYNHVTAKYYEHYMFQGVDVVKNQGKTFLNMLAINLTGNHIKYGEFSFSILLSFFGLILSGFFFRKFFYYSVAIISISLFFAFNYNIFDIQEYFLVVFLFLALFSAMFVKVFFSILDHQKLAYSFFTIILIFFIVFQIISNYNGIDRSHTYIYYDYPNAVLNSVEYEAIIINDDWSFLESPSLYLQNVLGVRKDVCLIHKGLSTFAWYNRDLKKNYNDLNDALKSRPYYISSDFVLEYVLEEKYKLKEDEYLIPDLLTFRVVRDKKYYPTKNSSFFIRFINNKDNAISISIPWTLENRLSYELKYNQPMKALELYERILNNFPEYKISDKTLEQMSKIEFKPR
ncbi:MAG: DUF2723 domain-containing protein [Ignavibacteriaceae bacterium]